MQQRTNRKEYNAKAHGSFISTKKTNYIQMKKLFLLSLTVAIVLVSQTELKAQQSYKNAFGARLGAANGITFKTFTQSNRAWDFILNFQSNDNYHDRGYRERVRFTALYEIHNPINNAGGLKYYYGVGGTLGSSKYRRDENRRLYAGLAGVLGLDYKFAEAPINVSLDWKPEFEIAPNSGYFDEQGLGLSIRFTF